MALICPYCMTQQAFNRPKCNHCGEDVSRDYVKNARRHPPVWLATFGFPGHGKTNAINSLAMHIESLDKIADEAYYDYLDSRTSDLVNEIRSSALQALVDVPPTPQGDRLPDPLLVALYGFPGDRADTLVIYDLAGQAAIEPKENYVRAIQNAKTAWFVVSLTDLKKSVSRDDQQPRTINDLFMRYRDIMESLNVVLSGRTILVNYTKADLLITSSRSTDAAFTLPDEVRDYVLNDPYVHLRRDEMLIPFDENEYRKELEEISGILRTFTRQKVPGGGAFLNQVEKKYGMKVEFCITSATGGGGNAVRIEPHRVLDPLLWAVYLNDRILDQTINISLIVDPGLYDLDYPTVIYNVLSAYGANVTTYHIGEKQPVTTSGQPPTARSSTAKISLVGPIIDSLDASVQPGRKLAIVLLGSNTPKDLDDFKFTSWEKKIYVIATDNSVANEWSNRVIIEPTDADMGLVVSGIMDRLDGERVT
jgi:hypothetical protein